MRSEEAKLLDRPTSDPIPAGMAQGHDALLIGKPDQPTLGSMTADAEGQKIAAFNMADHLVISLILAREICAFMPPSGG